jgi:molybdopterin converting factor small subunit
LIKIKLRSTYGIGSTDHLRSGSSLGKDLVVEVEQGTNVEGLLQKLPSLGPSEAFDDIMIHVFVNGKLRGDDYVLQPGDVIDLHIPVSGG